MRFNIILYFHYYNIDEVKKKMKQILSITNYLVNKFEFKYHRGVIPQ